MSHRFEPDRIRPAPPLGAVELSAFAGRPANDNEDALAAPPQATPRWLTGSRPLPQPVVAFVCGLTAALLVAGIGHALGITS